MDSNHVSTRASSNVAALDVASIVDDLLDEVEIMKTKSGDSSGGIRMKDQILKLQDEVTVEWLIDEWDFHYPYLLSSEPNSCSKLYFIVFKTWKYLL